jgi:hypothetical protein
MFQDQRDVPMLPSWFISKFIICNLERPFFSPPVQWAYGNLNNSLQRLKSASFIQLTVFTGPFCPCVFSNFELVQLNLHPYLAKL